MYTSAIQVKRERYMSDTRETAHLSLHSLWVKADQRIREPDAIERPMGSTVARRVETELGADICLFGGQLSVSAEFDKPDGTSETVEVVFPEDIRDLSVSEVRIDWSNDSGAGINTPPLRDFPKFAHELLALI